MKNERYRGVSITNEPLRHKDEYERTIISSCISPSFTSNDNLNYALKYLKPDYFYNPIYGDCFRAIIDMVNGINGAPPVLRPDLRTVLGYLETNADRYDTLRRERDHGTLTNFIVDLTVEEPTLDGRYIVHEIVELYKDRRRWVLTTELQNLIGEIGDTAAARKKIQDELEELELLGNERYEEYFSPSTLARTAAALKEQGTGYATGYTLGKNHHGEIIKRDLKIPPKQITVIAAATGHGKSTFCYNLAIRLIKRNFRKDKKPIKVVYLSYEESVHNIEPKIINVLLGMNIAEDNRAAIAADLAEGGKGSFLLKEEKDPDKEKRNKKLHKEYCEAVKTFYDWAKNGILTVKYCDLDTTELCGLIREYRKRDAADVVIIDYVQLLQKESSKAHGRNRPDELKEICADLRILANDKDLGLPIILASQFNREVQKSNDPRTMDKTNLGESANIEHSANVILGLWNCGETNAEKYYKTDKDDGPSDKQLTTDGERLLQYQHTAHIADPFVYARLLKSRDGINGLDMTLNYYGNCGRIDNTSDQSPTERLTGSRDETTEPYNTLTTPMKNESNNTEQKAQQTRQTFIFNNDNNDVLPF